MGPFCHVILSKTLQPMTQASFGHNVGTGHNVTTYRRHEQIPSPCDMFSIYGYYFLFIYGIIFCLWANPGHYQHKLNETLRDVLHEQIHIVSLPAAQLNAEQTGRHN